MSIGQYDVKSSPVYFYIQRSTDFVTEDVPIPFELERLNVGNAMNAVSGIFTAPRTELIFFSFFGLGPVNSFIFIICSNYIFKNYRGLFVAL